MTSISKFDIDALAFAQAVGNPIMIIANETPTDCRARERLLDEAFGPARHEKTVERLREGRLPASGLALAAKEGESLIGTLRLWHVRAGKAPALLLGPLAVARSCRARGIGRALMEESLSRARELGHAAVLLVGDAAYYEPFGFSRRHTLGLSLPGPVDEARFLGLELQDGALRGAQGLVTAAGLRDPQALAPEWELPRAA
ncbi:MAG TPA: N-acetyltransferase [Methylocella sp.]|nr:N-acetyltransferase [Methylocella sp.]